MQRLSLIFSAVLASGLATAQNLVPNPSFEEYNYCPSSISQIDSVVAWRNIGISPDYFNTCAAGGAAVPYNARGDQWPAEGEGYAGLGTGPEVDTKEYMQAELIQPLIPGVMTFLSMRVSPGGFGLPGWASPIYAGSHVGLRLSTEPLTQITYYGQFHFNEAQLYLPTILSDTSAWTVLAGSFVPDSAYRYVQVGCFFADSVVASIVLDPAGDSFASYAFIDMVCAAQVPGVCDELVGVPELTTGQRPRTIIFGENMALSVDSWGLSGLVDRAQLFDGIGRAIADRSLVGTTGSIDWPLPSLPSGSYFLVLALRDGSSFCIRSWKQE